MKYLLYFFTLSLVFLVSCNKESSPEGALEDLVSSRFSGSSRSKLLKLVTGKLKAQIEGMSEENIKKFLEKDGLVRKKMKITLKNCEANKCFITYILRYNDVRPQGSRFDVEVKKIAEVELIEKKWFVSDISNLKTYIDSKKEIKTN